MERTYKIVKNKIKCKKCGDIIESITVHDYKKCKCGAIAVDGGTEYLKWSYPGGDFNEWIEDLSEFEEMIENE